jgi:hypothetical protein
MEILNEIFAWFTRNWFIILCLVVIIIACLGFSYKVKSYDRKIDHWDPPKE